MIYQSSRSVNLTSQASSSVWTMIPWLWSLLRSVAVNFLRSRATRVALMRSAWRLSAAMTRSAVSASGQRKTVSVDGGDLAHPARPVANFPQNVGRYLVAGVALETVDDLRGPYTVADGFGHRLASDLQNDRPLGTTARGSLAKRDQLGGGGRVLADQDNTEVRLHHDLGRGVRAGSHVGPGNFATEIRVVAGLACDADITRVVDRGSDTAQRDQPPAYEGVDQPLSGLLPFLLQGRDRTRTPEHGSLFRGEPAVQGIVLAEDEVR